MATTNFNNDIIITETLAVSGSVGIGSTSLTGYNLRANKNITGATSAYGISLEGTIQSDVTSNAYYNITLAQTVAASFTLSNLYHYIATQGTFGAGSTITTQAGFWAGSNLVGATNNYGFYGNIPSGTNRWNLYMNGTADNYLAGALGIGSTNLTGINLRITKNITGLTTSYGILQDPVIQSGVTTAAFINRSLPYTATAAFTLGSLYHFAATQGVLGAGSTVTNQYGFFVDSATIGATNNYGFYGDIPASTNRWNLYMLGTANNFLSGSLGIGNGKTVPTATLDINGNALITGSLIISSSAAAATLQGSGSAVFSVNGTVGRLFQVDDSLTGSLFSVNTSAGLPVIEAFSNNTVRIGQYGQKVLYVSQSKVGIGKEDALNGILDVSGSTTMTGSVSITGSLSVNGTTATLGTGTTNYVPKFTSSNIIGNSNIQDSGALITLGTGSYVNGSLGVGTASPSFNIDVAPSSGSPVIRAVRSGGADVRLSASVTATGGIIGTYTSSPFLFYINGAEVGRFDTNGALGVGTSSLTGYNLRVSKTLTGSVSTTGIQSAGAIQSDVTSDAQYFSSAASTAAASFTITDLAHFIANQGTFGAGSTVTKQYGFRVAASLTGATNNYAFFSDIAAATNAWNLYMNGTANNYIAGALGIGSISLTGMSLRIGKTITGATTSYGVLQQGTVQSDVTTTAYGYYNEINTQATAFTLTNYRHFFAAGSTIGVGSTVTNQVGFFVSSNVTGATNNFAFYGDIAAAANRWNLYMNGTAGNYLAGALGIGTTSLTQVNLGVNRNLSGNTTMYGITSFGAIQSDVTVRANYFATYGSIQNTTFTLGALNHYIADSTGTVGSATITNQYGFNVTNALTAATNNYGFYGDIASGANRWNLYMNGTADNYIAGALGIGSTSLTGYTLRLAKSVTGATNYYGIESGGTVQSDVAGSMQYFQSVASTQATTFTLSALRHYFAYQGTFGAGSTVTTQIGYLAHESLIGATNNYGFYGNIPSGSNRWNLYMGGTAYNYLGGRLGVGLTSATSTNVGISLNITGGTTSNGIYQFGTVQSDVTTAAYGFRNQLNTAAASFTLTTYSHYSSQGGGTLGAGSTITNQVGFFAESNMGAQATNNYGFRGQLASASSAWNLYMDGNAGNFISGSTGMGTTTLSSEANLSLGALTTAEGGQLILQRGTSYNSASMIDNYQDTFRVLTGTNTISSRMDLELSHVTQNLRIFGDVVAYAASDKRLKENIQPIENALDKLDKIGGYTFDWNDKVNIHGHEGHDIGVIAQEIEEVLPETVATRDNGYKAVKYEKLTAFLIQVDKEQQKIISKQQQQIDKQQQQIDELIQLIKNK